MLGVKEALVDGRSLWSELLSPISRVQVPLSFLCILSMCSREGFLLYGKRDKENTDLLSGVSILWPPTRTGMLTGPRKTLSLTFSQEKNKTKERNKQTKKNPAHFALI